VGLTTTGLLAAACWYYIKEWLCKFWWY